MNEINDELADIGHNEELSVNQTLKYGALD